MKSPNWLLLIGLVLMVGAHMNIGIDVLAWFSLVPFLLFLQRTSGWRSRLWFSLVYVLAWNLAVVKITPGGIPLIFAPMFGVPIALFHLPAFLLWGRWRDRPGAMLLFPALLATLEWIQYTFTPLGSWGIAAYTQVDNLLVVQSVSLFGLAGLSFLIYWVNAALAYALASPTFAYRRLLAPGLALLLVLVFGALRYDVGKAKGVATVRVAAVGTESTVGAGPLPSDELRQ
ncbi:MAG: hypothetical protein KDC54_09105, partial [Lewinella sp.]|nr:hypothetical protein [Lewinella sp.]